MYVVMRNSFISALTPTPLPKGEGALSTRPNHTMMIARCFYRDKRRFLPRLPPQRAVELRPFFVTGRVMSLFFSLFVRCFWLPLFCGSGFVCRARAAAAGALVCRVCWRCAGRRAGCCGFAAVVGVAFWFAAVRARCWCWRCCCY